MSNLARPTIKTLSKMAIVALTLSGCSSLTAVQNTEPVAQGRSYQSQYRSDDSGQFSSASAALEKSAEKCAFDNGAANSSAVASVRGDVEELSAGDLLQVSVNGDDTFTGKYKISQDGTLKMPYMVPISMQGRSVQTVESDIRRALVTGSIYVRPPQVSVRVMDFAAARVFVAGAVFEPGTVTVGSVAGSDIDKLREEALGGFAKTRRLSRALQLAGGVRPDADLSRIVVRRNGRSMTVDVRPAMIGHTFSDLTLQEDDRIEVPSRGCFQQALMIPSPLTAPSVKVFMSNLTQPASANAASGINKDTTEMRYGTRFIQAVVAMNCMGGAKFTNADRSAVLFSRNPITGQSIVIERRIEDLVRRADRDDFNPYILPGDALACYDSGTTNVFEIVKVFSVAASSATLFMRLP